MAKKVYEESNIASIAEKIREKTGGEETYKISEMPSGIDEVYSAGQKSMVDESKIIEKTVTGENILSLDDVSEIPHELKVQLSSDTITVFSNVKVSQYGKNLCTAQQVYKGANRYKETVKDGRNCVCFSDGVSFKNYGFPFAPNTSYTLSIDYKVENEPNYEGVSTWSNIISIYYTDGTRAPIGNRGGCGWVKYALTTDAGKTIESIGIGAADYRTLVYVDMDTFQIETGSGATEYEPYSVKTLTANADGTVDGVKSISPKMTLVADVDGVEITATYNKSYGTKVEYDRFWGAYQQNGNRTDYSYAFELVWDNTIFKPKYDIKPTGSCAGMFSSTKISGDLVEIANNLGIEIDFSKATRFNSMFYLATNITRVGIIDTRSASDLGYMFESATALTTIDKLILKDDGSQALNMFARCSSLTNIVVEGTVGNNVNFSVCPLSHDSLMSIINALQDGVTSKTLTLGTTNLAKLTDAEKAIATQKGWTLA